jgi:hypothetical protein
MSLVDLILPKLGESIMEATILKWHKSVGDTIQLDETLLDIATDKVDSEIPSTAAGTITEILFDVNSVVPIGTVIARIQLIVLQVQFNKQQLRLLLRQLQWHNSSLWKKCKKFHLHLLLH